MNNVRALRAMNGADFIEHARVARPVNGRSLALPTCDPYGIEYNVSTSILSFYRHPLKFCAFICIVYEEIQPWRESRRRYLYLEFADILLKQCPA